jgi:uncharacterized membrane protein
MSAKIGTPLAPKMVAWVWFAVAAGFGLVCAWKAMAGQIDWTLSAVSAGVALLIYLEPRLRRREVETVGFLTASQAVVRRTIDLRHLRR